MNKDCKKTTTPFIRETLSLALFCAIGLLFFAGSVRAQAQSEEDQGQYSYRFHGGSGGGALAPGQVGGKEETSKTGVEAYETEEEKKARENIRNVLRLIDGDTVQIDQKVHIRLVGVDFPQFKNYQGNREYERFAREVRSWIDDFVKDPANSLKQHSRMSGPISYRSAEGDGFSFYYLYVPDILLEEIRKHELERYDTWVKEYRNEKQVETPSQKTARALADLGHLPSGMGQSSADRLKDVREYVISEAKYYYDDGSIKREEIYRDGKLIIKRLYSQDEELTDEQFYDEQAKYYALTQAK